MNTTRVLQDTAHEPAQVAFERATEAAAYVRDRLPTTASGPLIGIVLGSGLSAITESLEDVVRIACADIPHMPQARIPGHAGALFVGTLRGVRVACLSGRAHAYEGHSAEQVVAGVRLLSQLGAQICIITNAAGGVAPTCVPGSLMLITDHLNLTGINPLLGPNDERFGVRFVDMSVAYDADLRLLALDEAKLQNISLGQGVYAGLLGPTYETPAEIRMLEIMGASAVGMSTVQEVIALRHAQVRVLGLSCITNFAAGKSIELLSHEEVGRTASAASAHFVSLISGIVGRLSGR